MRQDLPNPVKAKGNNQAAYANHKHSPRRVADKDPSTAFARYTGCNLWERGFEAANVGTAQAKKMASILHADPTFEANKARLCRYIASNFVRRNNAFYAIESPHVSLNGSDVRRLTLRGFRRSFPDIELTQELVREVFKHAIEDHHNDDTQSVQVWDGSVVCRPDVHQPLVSDRDLVRLNSHKQPAYRLLGETGQDLTPLLELLELIFPQEQDRSLFLDWLSWSLQNESTKPGWAILLYSQRKGTGKSTLCSLVQALFGADNTMPVNGISKVTNRFNLPVITSKLIIAEEVQLKHGTTQGNSLKTFVTEKEVTTEGKGREAVKIPQCCCFLLTSNHFPSWIEAHERRYLVIEVDHDGHASGPRAADFAEFVSRLRAQLEDDRVVARIYNGLMARQQSNQFNPSSLNIAAIDTPIMKRIREGATEVVLDQLQETLDNLGVYAIPQMKLAKLFGERLKTNPARIPHLMPELGWKKHRAKWRGCDHARVLWVHPDYFVDNGRVRGPDNYDQPVDPVELEVELF